MHGSFCGARAKKRSRGSQPNRVGKVGVYLHLGSSWIRFREHGNPVRRKVAADRDSGLGVAAEVNAQLACDAPTLLSFTAVPVTALVAAFLIHQEDVLDSTHATVNRNRAALDHLVRFVADRGKPLLAHQLCADEFAPCLRLTATPRPGRPSWGPNGIHSVPFPPRT